MPDFDAIAVALAARFDASQLTAPVGYDTIRVATANLPNQMVPLPAVLVSMLQGEFTNFPGKRDSKHQYAASFYFNQSGDLSRDEVALRKWLTVLVDQLRLSTQLGGSVTVARVTGWEAGTLHYAGVDYSGIRLTIEVVCNEPWSAVA